MQRTIKGSVKIPAIGDRGRKRKKKRKKRKKRRPKAAPQRTRTSVGQPLRGTADLMSFATPFGPHRINASTFASRALMLGGRYRPFTFSSHAIAQSRRNYAANLATFTKPQLTPRESMLIHQTYNIFRGLQQTDAAGERRAAAAAVEAAPPPPPPRYVTAGGTLTTPEQRRAIAAQEMKRRHFEEMRGRQRAEERRGAAWWKTQQGREDVAAPNRPPPPAHFTPTIGAAAAPPPRRSADRDIAGQPTLTGRARGSTRQARRERRGTKPQTHTFAGQDYDPDYDRDEPYSD